MRTASLTRVRVVVLLSSLLVLSGIVTPTGQVEAMQKARIAPNKIAPANPFDFRNSSLALPTPAAISQDETISITSSPASGATVATGDYIVYTITAANGPAQSPPDIFTRFNLKVPAGTQFSSVAFSQFPYVVFINPPVPDTPGPVSFAATTGILLGGFLPNTVIEFTLAVQVTAMSGVISNNASYRDLDTPTISSGTVTHTVQNQ